MLASDADSFATPKYQTSFVTIRDQGCTKVRWRPEQETSLAPPCLNLRFSGSKCTVLKKVLATSSELFDAPQ